MSGQLDRVAAGIVRDGGPQVFALHVNQAAVDLKVEGELIVVINDQPFLTGRDRLDRGPGRKRVAFAFKSRLYFFDLAVVQELRIAGGQGKEVILRA